MTNGLFNPKSADVRLVRELRRLAVGNHKDQAERINETVRQIRFTIKSLGTGYPLPNSTAYRNGARLYHELTGAIWTEPLETEKQADARRKP